MSLPEAARMPVSPSLAHLCPGQHSSRSPGRDQTQAGRGAEKGKSRSVFGDFAAVSRALIIQCVVVVVGAAAAADVQLISRGGLRSDSSSPANSRCAAPSCRWPEVCEECRSNVRPI